MHVSLRAGLVLVDIVVAAPARGLGTIPANVVLVCFPPAPSSTVSSAPCVLGSQGGWQRRQVAILFRCFGDSDNGEAVNLSLFFYGFDGCLIVGKDLLFLPILISYSLPRS